MCSGVCSDVGSKFNIEIELVFKRSAQQTKHKIWMKIAIFNRSCRQDLKKEIIFITQDISILDMHSGVCSDMSSETNIEIRLCQPPDGSTSPKYKLLHF